MNCRPPLIFKCWAPESIIYDGIEFKLIFYFTSIICRSRIGRLVEIIYCTDTCLLFMTYLGLIGLGFSASLGSCLIRVYFMHIVGYCYLFQTMLQFFKRSLTMLLWYFMYCRHYGSVSYEPDTEFVILLYRRKTSSLPLYWLMITNVTFIIKRIRKMDRVNVNAKQIIYMYRHIC